MLSWSCHVAEARERLACCTRAAGGVVAIIELFVRQAGADKRTALPMNTRARRLRSSSAAEQDAAACDAPAEALPRRSRDAPLPRVPSEQLLATARLVRTESSKHLLQHLTMIASGAVLLSSCGLETAATKALCLVSRVAHRAGEHPLVITFDLMVAISSLLYLVRLHPPSRKSTVQTFALPEAPCTAPRLGPLRLHVSAGFASAQALRRRRQPAAQLVSYTYALYGWWRCCSLFVVVTVCSLLADSVMPQSKLVTSADRVFATAGTIVSPVSAPRASQLEASAVKLTRTCAGSRAADAWPHMLGHAALGAVCAGHRALQPCVFARVA